MNSTQIKGRRPSVMVVDDTLENLEVLKEMLQNQGFAVRLFPRASLAIQSALRSPPDLILLDVSMPEINGYEACARIKASETLREIPIIFISALSETADKVRAFRAGGVDYITKPFFIEEVFARLQTHLQLHEMRQELSRYNEDLRAEVAARIDETLQAQMAMLFALAKLAESREKTTGSHLERIQVLGFRFAQLLAEHPNYRHAIAEMGIDNLRFSSPLHDIGKVGIPDSILLKPGELSGKEWTTMKLHTVVGSETLESVLRRYPDNLFLQTAISIARSHHERWDGQGYPDGLAGVGIPLPARIIAIVDAYDALRSPRPYKNPLTHLDVCKVMADEGGRQFDPELLAIFLDEQDVFERLWAEVAAAVDEKARGGIEA